jgi:uncharacterized damage-inducible protein DinB
MHTTLSHHFLTQAYQNAWANHRLLKAVSQLSPADFTATRVSFFPSIRATLNHVLTVDWFYLEALERESRGEAPDPDCYRFFSPEQPFEACAPLQAAQRDADRRLIAYAQSLTDHTLERLVTIARPGTPQHDTRRRLLAHLLQHQIHHRGQVHAMLAGTSVKPPPLDEFHCAGELGLRQAEFDELGFSEAQIWS